MDNENLVAQVVRYIYNHSADERLTAQDVAQATGYTADYLSRLFTEQTGYSITAYIVRCRLSRAAELLTQTS